MVESDSLKGPLLVAQVKVKSEIEANTAGLAR